MFSFRVLIHHRRQSQDYAAAHYGKLPLHQSQSRPNHKRTDIATLSAKNDSEHVFLRARIQTSRLQSNKMAFLSLRQRTDTIQAMLAVNDKQVSKQMVKWAASLSDESIVLVHGTVVKSPESIKSCSIDDVEIHVNEVCASSIPSLNHLTLSSISSGWLQALKVDCHFLLMMHPDQKLPLKSRGSSVKFCWTPA
jgi:aspartyl/asparaginyl-tRNA synthetase